MRIIIVEEEEDLRTVLVEIFSRLDHDVRGAGEWLQGWGRSLFFLAELQQYLQYLSDRFLRRFVHTPLVKM